MKRLSLIGMITLPALCIGQVEIDTTLSYPSHAPRYHEMSISVDGEHLYNVAIKEPRSRISRGWIAVTDRHDTPLNEEQIESVMQRFFPEKDGTYYLILK